MKEHETKTSIFWIIKIGSFKNHLGKVTVIIIHFLKCKFYWLWSMSFFWSGATSEICRHHLKEKAKRAEKIRQGSLGDFPYPCLPDGVSTGVSACIQNNPLLNDRSLFCVARTDPLQKWFLFKNQQVIVCKRITIMSRREKWVVSAEQKRQRRAVRERAWRWVHGFPYGFL